MIEPHRRLSIELGYEDDPAGVFEANELYAPWDEFEDKPVVVHCGFCESKLRREKAICDRCGSTYRQRLDGD